MIRETVRVVAHITARVGKEADVQAILSGMIEPTHQEFGCIHYELLHNLNNPAEFTLLEEWETQAALDRHSMGASQFFTLIPQPLLPPGEKGSKTLFKSLSLHGRGI